MLYNIIRKFISYFILDVKLVSSRSSFFKSNSKNNKFFQNKLLDSSFNDCPFNHKIGTSSLTSIEVRPQYTFTLFSPLIMTDQISSVLLRNVNYLQKWYSSFPRLSICPNLRFNVASSAWNRVTILPEYKTWTKLRDFELTSTPEGCSTQVCRGSLLFTILNLVRHI